MIILKKIQIVYPIRNVTCIAFTATASLIAAMLMSGIPIKRHPLEPWQYVLPEYALTKGRLWELLRDNRFKYIAVVTFIVTTSGGLQTFTIPGNWNSGNNKTECIGSGASGGAISSSSPAASGGGGGGYSSALNLTFINGGRCDAGAGGAGGGSSSNGGNGTEYDGSHGSGGGGGGAGAFNSANATGGSGGLYGGGGGGASSVGGAVTSGTGTQGLIVVTNIPATVGILVWNVLG